MSDVQNQVDISLDGEYKGKTVRFTCPNCQHVFLPNAKERQSKVGASSRRKGANFERAVAKKLQQWWGNGSVWRRTPMSGGSVLKDGFDLAGDVCCNAADMRYHWELKNSPTKFTGLHQLMTAPKCAVWEWFNQAKVDCPKHRQIILVVNRPDEPTYCMADIDADCIINERLSDCNIKYMMFENDHTHICIWLLDDMLKSDPNFWR